MTFEQETIWLAGLLEGEGNFFFADHTCPRVALKMTDEDVVNKAAKIMGAKKVFRHDRSKPNAPRKPVFVTYVLGQHAVAIMKQVLPFMGQRRSAKIEEILDQYSRRVTKSEARVRDNARRKRCPKTISLFAVA